MVNIGGLNKCIVNIDKTRKDIKQEIKSFRNFYK